GGQIKRPVAGPCGSEDAWRGGIVRVKSGVNALVYLVAVRANAGADGSQARLRPRAKRPRHRLQRAQRDAARRAPPAGVRQADGAMERVEEADGKTVGDGDAEQQSRRC